MNIHFRLDEIDQAAERLWEAGSQKKIWAFHGPMGAGKTTLIHHLCAFLRVPDQVSSPTFALINEYESPEAGVLYHMDWYRLRNEEEAIQAGIQDALLSGNRCFVEWPEQAPGLLGEDTLHLFLEVLDENSRRIEC